MERATVRDLYTATDTVTSDTDLVFHIGEREYRHIGEMWPERESGVIVRYHIALYGEDE